MSQLTSKKAKRLARKGERLLTKAVAIEMAATEDIERPLSRDIARFGADDIRRALNTLQHVRL